MVTCVIILLHVMCLTGLDKEAWLRGWSFSPSSLAPGDKEISRCCASQAPRFEIVTQAQVHFILPTIFHSSRFKIVCSCTRSGQSMQH